MLRRLIGQIEFLLGTPPGPRAPGANPPPTDRPAPPGDGTLAPPTRTPPSPSPVPPTAVADLPVPLVFVRNPRARRYILRLGPDRVARVTIPRGGSEAFARRFAQDHGPWLRRQLERAAVPVPVPAPWRPGTRVWFRGEPLPLSVAGGRVLLGTPGPDPGHGLDLGLDARVFERFPDARPAVESALRRWAAQDLPPRVLAAAARLGLDVGRVSVRSQRSRWGSCSRRRTISLNWRLVQTPDQVRDYIIAHELAHLREMNHSRRFWKLVGEFFPEWREAEAWLKRHGREIIGDAGGRPGPGGRG